MNLDQRSWYADPAAVAGWSSVDIEAAIGAALRRNRRLRGSHVTATAGPEGLVTLTGSVATHALRREVELACWTVSGVWTLHDDLVVGH